MRVCILAGGLGTRLMEETESKPKPMVEIGGKPMLWHIMNIYAAAGHRECVVALGYKGECIEQYCRQDNVPGVKVQAIDTGLHTGTGGRLKQLKSHLTQTFMMTYGDGVSNVDLNALLAFHRAHGKLATMTVVHPPARFGTAVLDGDQVMEFSEKPQMQEGWINGGFFVLEPQVLDYIEGNDVMFEQQPLGRLAKDGQLMAFRHDGFWQCMDTLRDVRFLNHLWATAQAPWKVW